MLLTSFVEEYIVPVFFVCYRYALTKNSNLYRTVLFSLSLNLFGTHDVRLTVPSNFLFFNFVSCAQCAVIVFLTKHNFILKSKNNIIVGDKYIFSQVCYQASLRT